MPRKKKETSIAPTLQAADTTSRRAFKGTIIAAIITAVAAISAATINSCGNPFKPSPSPTPMSFVGRVIDKNTEQKIRGAAVSLEEKEGVPPLAYSDNEGIFSFPVGDPNKELRLRIEANKYVNYDLRVTPAKNQGIQDVRLTLKTDEDSPIQQAKPTQTLLPPEPKSSPCKAEDRLLGKC